MEKYQIIEYGSFNKIPGWNIEDNKVAREIKNRKYL
jgi:hypothetical protein